MRSQQAPRPSPLDGHGARLEAIDLLRGLIMVLMALDHARDFFGDLGAQPTDLAATTTGLFLTRWVTHFCAPVFFLLTGTGAALRLRGRPKRELARFLLTRGLWLIFLELVIMRFALQFNVDYHVTVITVLWALGWAMIVLAVLIWLPLWAIAAFGAALVVGHNGLDSLDPGRLGPWRGLWLVLHQPGIVYNDGRSLVLVAYVLIPWVGVTALGYALGTVYGWGNAARHRLLLYVGCGLVVAFVLLRLSNLYGDPSPWVAQRTWLWTVLSFINVTKYPPSLLFLMMTLGPALLLLRVFDASTPRWLRPALVVGRVPLFFYVLHFFLIHLLAVATCYLRYGEAGGLVRSPDLGHFPFSAPQGWDMGLPAVYAMWVAVVLTMWPLCRWFGRVKRRRRDWWLSYL